MSGPPAYVSDFHPKCSKFCTIVHLGPKAKKNPLKGTFFRPLKNQKNLKVIRHMPHNEKLKAIQMMLGQK